MQTFAMLTRLSPDAIRDPSALHTLEQQAVKRIEQECPGVEWVHSFAVLGPCDYLDIFRAPDSETAAKVSVLIRTFGHASTEVWGLTEWDRFKELVRGLSGPAQATAG